MDNKEKELMRAGEGSVTSSDIPTASSGCVDRKVADSLIRDIDALLGEWAESVAALTRVANSHAPSDVEHKVISEGYKTQDWCAERLRRVVAPYRAALAKASGSSRSLAEER